MPGGARARCLEGERSAGACGATLAHCVPGGSMRPDVPRSRPMSVLAPAPVLSAPFLPPSPVPPERELPFLARLRGFRDNVISTWPRNAYEAPALDRVFLGRRILLLNEPAAVRHVL